MKERIKIVYKNGKSKLFRASRAGYDDGKEFIVLYNYSNYTSKIIVEISIDEIREIYYLNGAMKR